MSLDINDAMSIVRKYGKYETKKFYENDEVESWVIIKDVRHKFRKKYEAQINITFNKADQLVVFVMPFHDGGLGGLKGENISIFDSMLHNLNSRTNMGYFTKYTFNSSYTFVYMHQLPLDRIGIDWFTDTLDYFLQVFKAYKPIVDQIIEKLELEFDEEAGLYDVGRQFLADNVPQLLPELKQS